MVRTIACAIAALIVQVATAQTARFCMAKDGKAATIVVDQNDWKSVHRAANDLSDDVRKVTGFCAPLNDKGEMINDHLLYDLQGRQVIRPIKDGIYIKNGKKIFVK